MLTYYRCSAYVHLLYRFIFNKKLVETISEKSIMEWNGSVLHIGLGKYKNIEITLRDESSILIWCTTDITD